MASVIRRSLLLLALCALAACGTSAAPMTDADAGRVERWSAAYKLVATDMLAASDALAKSRYEPAGEALGRLPERLDAAEAPVRAIETAPLRGKLADHMRITRRAVAALDGVLQHLRTNERDMGKRIKLVDELRKTNDALLRADAKIHERILEHATPAQERKLAAAIPRPEAVR